MLFLFVQVDIISHFGDKKQKYIAEFTTVRECLVDKLSARCANERLSFVFVYFFFSIPLIINNTCDILWYRFSSMHIIKKWIWSCAPHQSPLVHFVYIIYDLCRLKFIARYFWTAVHSAEMCVCVDASWFHRVFIVSDCRFVWHRVGIQLSDGTQKSHHTDKMPATKSRIPTAPIDYHYYSWSEMQRDTATTMETLIRLFFFF